MKRIAKSTLTIICVACMLLIFGLAGGSDAGNITPGQALLGGTLAIAGCIVCAWGANRIEGR